MEKGMVCVTTVSWKAHRKRKTFLTALIKHICLSLNSTDTGKDTEFHTAETKGGPPFPSSC